MKTFVFSFKVKPPQGSALYKTVKHGYAAVYCLGENVESAEISGREYLTNGGDGNEKWEIISSHEQGHECAPEHLLKDQINKALHRKAQKFGVAVSIAGVGFGAASQNELSTN